MSAIERQREIIDRRSLAAALDGLAASGEPSRVRVVEVLKAALLAGRAEVERRFAAQASGTDTVHELSFLMDQRIRTLYDFTLAHVYPIANPTAGERIAVVAVGGYGRGELAPFSVRDRAIRAAPAPSTNASIASPAVADADTG